MKTYYHNCEEENGIRVHPWDYAESNPSQRYYDFKLHPQLIPKALEDFQPWNNEQAIQMFYRLLTWLNDTTSPLESNDSAFRGPHENKNTSFSKTLQCKGRLMILYRHILFNTLEQHIKWLHDAVKFHLNHIDKSFEWGVVGTTIVPVRYVSLPIDKQNGEQIMMSFWAWGNNNKEVFLNLERTICAIDESLHCTCQEILEVLN